MPGEGMRCVWCDHLLPMSAWDKSDFCCDDHAEAYIADQDNRTAVQSVLCGCGRELWPKATFATDDTTFFYCDSGALHRVDGT